MFLENYIGERQHGFIPQKGTLTAWRALVANMHKYKYIMEIDLSNCFGEIQADSVSDVLRELRAPEEIIEYIEKINRCTPN
jgi:ubiquinone biosynthesis protein UbiJ